MVTITRVYYVMTLIKDEDSSKFVTLTVKTIVLTLILLDQGGGLFTTKVIMIIVKIVTTKILTGAANVNRALGGAIIKACRVGSRFSLGSVGAGASSIRLSV